MPRNAKRAPKLQVVVINTVLGGNLPEDIDPWRYAGALEKWYQDAIRSYWPKAKCEVVIRVMPHTSGATHPPSVMFLANGEQFLDPSVEQALERVDNELWESILAVPALRASVQRV